MVGTRVCRSTCHSLACQNSKDGNEKIMVNVENHVIDKLVRKRIREKNLVQASKCSSRKQFICRQCIESLKNEDFFENLPSASSAKKTTPIPRRKKAVSRKATIVDKIVDKIMNKELSEDELCRISHAIGKSLPKNLIQEKEQNVAQRTERLLNYSYENHYNGYNLTLRQFLEGIVDYSNFDVEKAKMSKRYLAKAMDCIMRACNNHFISVPALAEHVIIHLLSSSRLVSDMIGHASGSGSYDTVQRVLEQLKSPKPVVPEGDVCVAFDNEQKLGKNYNIQLGCHLKTSVVTSMAAFQFPSNIQYNIDVQCPKYWDGGEHSELLQKYEDLRSELNDIHAKYRLKFIEHRIKKVQQQMNSCDDGMTEHEELNSEDEENYSMKYDRVPSCPSACKIVDQECVLVNPNTLSTVETVLDSILEKCIANGRKWVIVVCDGLPYGLAKTLIMNTFVCADCRIKVEKNDIEQHQSTYHESQQATIHRKYEKLVLRPGNGHFEMNFCRAIMSVYFDLYIQPVAHALNFKSPRALEYVKLGHNHHITWQILTVVFESLSDELIRIYINHCLENNESPSVDSYLKWSSTNTNPNFKSAEALAFTWLHSIFLFRAAVRQCNDTVALAAREKACGIFFGFNHPTYKEISASDFFWLLSMPEDTKSLTWMQSSRRENSGAGQGLDFLLEERNGVIKDVIPTFGIPTEEQWLLASCIVGKIEKIRNLAFGGLQITEKKTRKRKLNVNKIINAGRIIYRNSELFDTEGQHEFRTVDGSRKIEPEFLKCLGICEENKYNYYKSHLNHSKPFIKNVIRFEEERITYLNSNTKAEIAKEIEKHLQFVPQFRVPYYKGLMKNANKDELCTLLELIELEISDYEEFTDLSYEWEED